MADEIVNIDAAYDQMQLAMIQILDTIKDQVRSRTPVNFGLLRNSITRGEPVWTGNALFGQVMTPSPYGQDVERGPPRS